MNISRDEQRVLHALAQGGLIHVEKDERGRIVVAQCFNRDGYILSTFNLDHFKKLKKKRAIASSESRPYRITPRGLELVRAEVDNR